MEHIYGPVKGLVSLRLVTAVLTLNAGEIALVDWAKIVDCGDAPLTFLDNTMALKQLDKAHKIISGRKSANSSYGTPRIITLGGDHTTTLSALRSAYERWGQVSVIHFDSHLDTWDPKVIGGGISHYAGVNHGTFLHLAHEEGLIRNSSIHAGIRAPIIRPKGDLRNDLRCGFQIVKARDIDRIGTHGVIEKLKQRVAGSRVYISVDIDVLDPAFAPGEFTVWASSTPQLADLDEERLLLLLSGNALVTPGRAVWVMGLSQARPNDLMLIKALATGTSEVGGWTTRELLTILDGLSGMEVIGGDIVEVAPIYDNPGETTVLAAAEVAHSLLTLMVQKPVKA
ncbi:hypothetical protein B0A49_07687 [Cryomyces minteri]|uniref:Agmatinase 1 n=1 Tax=Cryomyces minteri TaxID=331657 RepID=A0A4U0WGD4_9PEZI|nr:hypothetical protein B0A49_07687 [Cryomyces minteri]